MPCTFGRQATRHSQWGFGIDLRGVLLVLDPLLLYKCVADPCCGANASALGVSLWRGAILLAWERDSPAKATWLASSATVSAR